MIFQSQEVSFALHQAALSGKPEIVLRLLRGGADPTIRDDRGRLAYQCAADKGVRDTFRR